jgi:AcrR family transcriptional regulator
MERSAGSKIMEERILETADRLFYGEGIRAVGVDTIEAEVGISKRTLYNYFPSRDDLIVGYLARRFRPIAVSERPPAKQILEDFDRLERAFADSGFRGCRFVNAAAELKQPGHAANKIAVAFARRDPYSAADRLKTAVRRLSRDHERLWLWAPAQGRGDASISSSAAV